MSLNKYFLPGGIKPSRDSSLKANKEVYSRPYKISDHSLSGESKELFHKKKRSNSKDKKHASEKKSFETVNSSSSSSSGGSNFISTPSSRSKERRSASKAKNDIYQKKIDQLLEEKLNEKRRSKENIPEIPKPHKKPTLKIKINSGSESKIHSLPGNFLKNHDFNAELNKADDIKVAASDNALKNLKEFEKKTTENLYNNELHRFQNDKFLSIVSPTNQTKSFSETKVASPSHPRFLAQMIGDTSIDNYDFGEVRKNADSDDSSQGNVEAHDDKALKGIPLKHLEANGVDVLDQKAGKSIISKYVDCSILCSQIPKAVNGEREFTCRKKAHQEDTLDVESSGENTSRAEIYGRNREKSSNNEKDKTEAKNGKFAIDQKKLDENTVVPIYNIFTKIRQTLEKETSSPDHIKQGESNGCIKQTLKDCKSDIYVPEEFQKSEDLNSCGDISSHFMRAKAQFEELNTERFLTNLKENYKENGQYEYRRKTTSSKVPTQSTTTESESNEQDFEFISERSHSIKIASFLEDQNSAVESSEKCELKRLLKNTSNFSAAQGFEPFLEVSKSVEERRESIEVNTLTDFGKKYELNFCNKNDFVCSPKMLASPTVFTSGEKTPSLFSTTKKRLIFELNSIAKPPIDEELQQMIDSSDFLQSSENTISNTTLTKFSCNTQPGFKYIQTNYLQLEAVDGASSSSQTYMSLPTENTCPNTDRIETDFFNRKHPKNITPAVNVWPKEDVSQNSTKHYENMNEPDFQESLIGHKNASLSETSKEMENSFVNISTQAAKITNCNNDVIYEQTEESLLSSPQGDRRSYRCEPDEGIIERNCNKLVMTFHPQQQNDLDQKYNISHNKPETLMKTPKFQRKNDLAPKEIESDLLSSASSLSVHGLSLSSVKFSKASSKEGINNQILMCEECNKLVALSDYKSHKEGCRKARVPLQKTHGNLIASSHTRTESLSSVSNKSQTKLCFSSSISDLVSGLRHILDICRESSSKQELCLLGFLIKLEEYLKVIFLSQDVKELSLAIQGIKSLMKLLASDEETNKNYLETIGICQKCLNLAQEKIEILEESSEDDSKFIGEMCDSENESSCPQNYSNESEQEVFNTRDHEKADDKKRIKTTHSNNDEKRRFYELAANIRKHLPADHKSKRLLIAQIYMNCKELNIPEKDWSGFVCSVFLSAE